jgi:hypothetical protein
MCGEPILVIEVTELLWVEMPDCLTIKTTKTP